MRGLQVPCTGKSWAWDRTGSYDIILIKHVNHITASRNYFIILSLNLEI